MNTKFKLLVTIFCTVLHGVLPANESGAADADTDYLASLIDQARRNGDYFPDLYRMNPTLSEAELFAVQDQYVKLQLADKDRVIGYKAGFVPRASIGGVLLASGQLGAGSIIRKQNFKLLVVEAEIAFRFCRVVEQPLADLRALKDAVCELAPALEIADGALENFAQIKRDFRHLRAALIPLNVAYAHIMLGQAVPTKGVDLANLMVSMKHQQSVIGERALDPEVDLWSNVLWTVNHFVLKRGYRIEAGQVIIPGNLTGIHVADSGRYVADFGALGTLAVEVLP